MTQTQVVVTLLVALAVVGGAFVLSTNDAPKDVMVEKEGDVMMEKDATDAMMDKGDETMMEKGADAMMEKEDGAMMESSDTMMGDDAMMSMKGTYEAYAPEKLALAEKGDVVLFFHADWCPTCRSIEKEIENDMSKISDGLHILKVDYDTAIALRQKYGVTVQHTFVQVDAAGTLIAKWSDATNLAGVLSRVK